MKLPERREDGETLEFHGKNVEFSLYPTDYIGQHVIPLQQPWSYAEFAIKNSDLEQQRERETLAYLQQAKSFYDAARLAAEDSAPLLWYYCFLNLAKTLLAKTEDLDDLGRAMHGIGDPADNADGYAKLTTQAIRTWGDLKQKDRMNIFAYLCKKTSSSLAAGAHDISVSDLIHQIPCVHRAYMQAYGKNSSFVKLRAARFLECRHDGKKGEIWTTFWLRKEDFSRTLTFKDIKTQLETNKKFKAVTPGDPKLHAFEVGPFAYAHLGKSDAIRDMRRSLRKEIRSLVLPHGYLYYAFNESTHSLSLDQPTSSVPGSMLDFEVNGTSDGCPGWG